MKLLITFMVMLAAAVVAAIQIIRNFKMNNLGDKRTLVSAAVMLSEALAVLSDMLSSAEEPSLYGLTMEVMPSVVAMWLMSSFMSDGRIAKWGICSSLLANGFVITFNVCRDMSIMHTLPDVHYVYASSFIAAVMAAVFIYGIWDWLRCVKVLMKCGTVWAVVCLTVDVVYFCLVITGVALVQLKCAGLGVFLLGSLVPAMGIRIMLDSKFLIWRKHETLIVESMRLTSVPSASDPSHIEEVYKELYGRVVAYFEARKPFLDSELTINTVVKDLYSNKLYISRAISQFTGRNFCQFVNYYRVMYSMECFRENPDTRIHELATMSGFNSVVSYNMAFRLFMGENPSEWSRKEKGRLIKKK